MKQFNYIFIAILVLLTAAVAYAQSTIPESIIEKSNQFIISKVGEDFFNNYIAIDYEQSQTPNEMYCGPKIEDCYLIVYSFKIPKKPYIPNDSLGVLVDIDGNIILDSVSGVPDCISDPKECDFSIDETEAIQIAKNAELEDGIADWTTSFHWHTTLKTYVWEVRNTLYSDFPQPSYGEEGRKIGVLSGGAGGKLVLIDANSGEILEKSEWRAMAEAGEPTQDKINFIVYILIAVVILFIFVFITWRIFKRKK